MQSSNPINPEEIKQIIIKEIEKDKSIGILKGDLFFMDVEFNNKINSYTYILITICIFLLLFSKIVYKILIKLFPSSILFCYLFILYVVFPVALIIPSLSKNYLVYDIKNSYFYTLSYLLNLIPLPFSLTNYVVIRGIKNIVLQTESVSGGELMKKGGMFICDRIIAIYDDYTEVALTHYMQSKDYHKVLINRCNLFSKCFNIDFVAKGNNLIIEEQKRLEKLQKYEPFIFIIVLICFIIGIAYIFFIS